MIEREDGGATRDVQAVLGSSGHGEWVNSPLERGRHCARPGLTLLTGRTYLDSVYHIIID
jgi:hypothetical protein